MNIYLRGLHWRGKITRWYPGLDVTCQDVNCCVDGGADCSGFTNGLACFCEPSCVDYDDCCPDFDTCISTLWLAFHQAIWQTTYLECLIMIIFKFIVFFFYLDDCHPIPCHNGATCNDLAVGYECACPVGFTGTNCETRKDNNRFMWIKAIDWCNVVLLNECLAFLMLLHGQ